MDLHTLSDFVEGNTCDDANDPNGCIFTQNLLVPDVTADEINSAVAGISAGSSGATAAAAATSAAVDVAAASGTADCEAGKPAQISTNEQYLISCLL